MTVRLLIGRAAVAGRPRPVQRDRRLGLPAAALARRCRDRLRAPRGRKPIGAALRDLPPAPRRVVLLRDAEGLTGGEVGQLLQVNQAGQRVLLHRGRARLRRALAQAAGSW